MTSCTSAMFPLMSHSDCFIILSLQMECMDLKARDWVPPATVAPASHIVACTGGYYNGIRWIEEWQAGCVEVQLSMSSLEGEPTRELPVRAYLLPHMTASQVSPLKIHSQPPNDLLEWVVSLGTNLDTEEEGSTVDDSPCGQDRVQVKVQHFKSWF